jgi:hypothetical protein
MSALLDSIRTVERVMAVRSVVPLTLVVIALSVHLALEVDRSRAANLGIALEDKVVPAMANVADAFHSEMKARFVPVASSSTTASTATVTTESLTAIGTSDALARETDRVVGIFANEFVTLHADSSTLADSQSNLAACSAPVCGADAIRQQLQVFRNTNDASTAIVAVTAIQSIIPRTLTAAFIDASSTRKSGQLLLRLGASYVEAVANAYLELTTIHALFHRSRSLNADTAAVADASRAVEGFLMARASLRYLLTFSDIDSLGRADPLLYADIITAARLALAEADVLLPVNAASSPLRDDSSFVLSLDNLRNVNGLVSEALGVAREPSANTNRKERDGLWVAVAVTAVVLLCLILTIIVAAVHIRKSSEETRLMAQFSNAEHTREIGQAFQPVLVGLRVDMIANAMSTAESDDNDASAAAKKHSNKSSLGAASANNNNTTSSASHAAELVSIYAAAARMVCEIRPFLPQTLFGTLVDDGGAHAIEAAAASIAGAGGRAGPTAVAGVANAVNPTLAAAEAAAQNTLLGGVLRKTTAPVAWRPWEHSIRLDSTVCSTRCTLLTVVPLQPHRDVMADPNGALLWFNTVLATTVALVNESGGSIQSVENNGIIVCMWNVTLRTSNASAVALRVSRALVTCFEQNIDLNIVTGQCMVANAKTGRRRNVVVVGSALEFSERVLMLNRLHNSSIVLDFDSYRDLSLEEQAQCRPIALLHTSPTSRVVLYSADTQRGRTFSVQQRKTYLGAFALYQNGMYEDSLELFTQYLRTYGVDSAAEWIVSHLLSHKLKPIQTIAMAARVNNADRGDAIEHFEELRVWGGG